MFLETYLFVKIIKLFQVKNLSLCRKVSQFFKKNALLIRHIPSALSNVVDPKAQRKHSFCKHIETNDRTFLYSIRILWKDVCIGKLYAGFFLLFKWDGFIPYIHLNKHTTCKAL